MRRFASGILAGMLATACGACGGAIDASTAPRSTAARTVESRSTQAPARRGVPRPALRQWRIPITDRRRRETVAYAERHYGRHEWRIAHPHVIVEHLTVNDSVAATHNTFAPDVPDVELHELPGVCAQFVIGRDGEIVELTPVRFMCRHTVGLNWTAIGIEHVGYREQDVLRNRAQMRASLRLTRWLRCRFHVKIADVIGHAESVQSPYHHERVAALRTQTHGDWRPWAMQRYRALLRRHGCPAQASEVDASAAGRGESPA